MLCTLMNVKERFGWHLICEKQLIVQPACFVYQPAQWAARLECGQVAMMRPFHQFRRSLGAARVQTTGDVRFGKGRIAASLPVHGVRT